MTDEFKKLKTREGKAQITENRSARMVAHCRFPFCRDLLASQKAMRNLVLYRVKKG
jgi:hypothetical protein